MNRVGSSCQSYGYTDPNDETLPVMNFEPILLVYALPTGSLQEWMSQTTNRDVNNVLRIWFARLGKLGLGCWPVMTKYARGARKQSYVRGIYRAPGADHPSCRNTESRSLHAK